MTSRNVNILKVIARYSVYFIGILGVLFLAAKLGGLYDEDLRISFYDKHIWYLLKNYFKLYGKGVYEWGNLPEESPFLF